MAEIPQAEESPTEPEEPQRTPGDDTPTIPLAHQVAPTPSLATSLSPRRRSRRRWWISLAVVALLMLVAGGAAGAAYVHAQLQQPMRAVNAFCADLTAQNYAGAYGYFSAGMRRQLSSTQFPRVAQTLDAIEGRATSCRADGQYHYSLGDSSASMRLALARSKQGTLTGPLRLVHERDGWKVDTLDDQLLGVNLGALSAAESYCTALQAQDFATAYKALDAKLQKATSQATYTAQAQEHTQVDGPIQSCTLNSLGHGNTSAAASFTISLVRAKLGARRGAVAFTASQGVWHVTSVDASLIGSDLGALDAGAAFCGALTNNDYNGAYNLLSGNARNTYSEAQFQQQFGVTGILKWSGCAPDFTTYQVSGAKASYNTALKVTRTDTGASTSLVFALTFAREGSAWKLDNWVLVTVQ